MDAEKLVAECPLFRQIHPDDLTAMLKCLSAREITAQKGAFIETTSGGKPLMGVVLEGSVEMISEDYFGKKSILTVLNVGNLFGETYSCLQCKLFFQMMQLQHSIFFPPDTIGSPKNETGGTPYEQAPHAQG